MLSKLKFLKFFNLFMLFIVPVLRLSYPYIKLFSFLSNFKHKCDLIIPNHIENECAFDVLKSYVVNKTSKVN